VAGFSRRGTFQQSIVNFQFEVSNYQFQIPAASVISSKVGAETTKIVTSSPVPDAAQIAVSPRAFASASIRESPAMQHHRVVRKILRPPDRLSPAPGEWLHSAQQKRRFRILQQILKRTPQFADGILAEM